MKVCLQLFLFSFFVFGCSSSRGIELSKFSYNDRFHNSLIVDRAPHYGLDNPDGCVVEGQVLLAISSLSESQYNGVVKDVKTHEPIPGANVKFFYQEADSPVTVITNKEGQFEYTKESPISKIEVFFVGYRTLVIDLRNNKLL